jgi:ABC-type lipoprotein export system ATPase subunit
MLLPIPTYNIATKKVESVVEFDYNVQGSLVIIGANGSGKSKLGSWIEDKINAEAVKRISGQRALVIPENVPLKSVEQSFNEVAYGHATNKNRNNRWGQGKTSTLLNDIASVLSLIFAQEAKRDADFTRLFKSTENKNTLNIPESPIDKLVRIWNELLPHRKISLVGNKVKISVNPEEEYSGNEMSDGEKVTIYLLSQCLTSPLNHTVIIDEPESHLHRAIVSKLWDLVEGIRPDCQFIYITHDFEFATSRQNGVKIWIKGYTNPLKWDWEFIEDSEDLPENLKLELLGSRKNILFTEGVLGGIDHAIFSEVYPNYKIVPVATCSKVIESTKSFKSYSQLTHLKIAGIIDRDFRTEQELTALSTGSQIYSLPVAEIENILISEALFRVVAENLGYNPNEKVNELVQLIALQLNQHLTEQVSRRTSDEMLFKVEKFNRKAIGVEAIRLSFNTEVSSINIEELFANNLAVYTAAIANNSLNGLLAVYNNKGLAGIAATCVGLKDKKAYSSYVLRMLNGENKNEFVTAIKTILPILD